MRISRKHYLLIVFAAISALVCIGSHFLKLRTGIYVFKPLTMVFILGIVFWSTRPSRYRTLIGMGLICSLAGDIFLMLPGKWFLHGLISFLIAHLWYILAFHTGKSMRKALLSATPFAIFGFLVFAFLAPGLRQFAVPVAFYIAVILAMGWQAWHRWCQGIRGAGFALIGAFLFIASDTFLAVNRFRFPLPASPLLVLGPYFAAQTLIALSAAAQDSKS